MKSVTVILGCLVGLAVVAPVCGIVVAPPPPIAERVAKFECIVVAKVVAVESQRIIAPVDRNSTQKADYAIAVLKVTENIKGATEEKPLRVGFLAPAERKGSIRPSPRFGLTFKVGQEGLFFLTRHFQEPFYLAPTYFAFISAQSFNFQEEVSLSRLVQKMGTRLAGALESQNPQDRYYAAALLIQQYRDPKNAVKGARTELVDAKESQLILKALAEADWNQAGALALTPWKMFSLLGLTAKDGFTLSSEVRTAKERQRAAQAWLQKHAATYRIERILATPARPHAP